MGVVREEGRTEEERWDGVCGGCGDACKVMEYVKCEHIP